MNHCLFIQSQTLIESPRDYRPPVGLIVFDVPLFIWTICHRGRYYRSNPQLWEEAYPGIRDSCVWAFPGQSNYRRGGTLVFRGDQEFRVILSIGGAIYRTIWIPCDRLLKSGVFKRPVKYLSRASIDPDFKWAAARYMAANHERLTDWLA